MNNTNKTLNIEDIQNMSQDQLINLYQQGYTLESDIETITGTTSTGICNDVGLTVDQCKYLKYGAIAVGGLIVLSFVTPLITSLMPKQK